MTTWCIARLKPNRLRLVRVQPEYREVRTRAGEVAYRQIPRSGEATFTQQVILNRLGFEVYMPARYEWRVVNRFTKEKERQPIQRLPGWAFIGFDDAPRWNVLKDSGMVSFFATIDGRPALLTDAEMMKIRQRFGDVTKPDVERFMRSHAEFSVGDMVALPGGPFDGVQFRVREISGEVTRVIGDILGASRDIEVSTWDLRKTG